MAAGSSSAYAAVGPCGRRQPRRSKSAVRTEACLPEPLTWQVSSAVERAFTSSPDCHPKRLPVGAASVMPRPMCAWEQRAVGLRSLCMLWLLCSTQCMALGDHGGAPGFVNQLAGLPPLPKPHYASNSGIAAEDVANPARMALWGEFARIAHTLPVSLMSWGADDSTMAAVIALASLHNASISGEYSPWCLLRRMILLTTDPFCIGFLYGFKC